MWRFLMRKYVLASLMVMLVSLLFTVPAFAHYGTISGSLKDGKTFSDWNNGAYVEAFNCNTGFVLGSQTIAQYEGAGSSDFSFALTYEDPSLNYIPICVLVQFSCAGCSASNLYPEGPGQDSDGPFPNDTDTTGDLATGLFFADTGPEAVTMAGLSGTSGLALMGVLPLAAVAGLGAVKLNRKKQQ
jgi:hypothetical protein